MIRVLTPFKYRTDPRYRFVLLEDVTVQVDGGLRLGCHEFCDASGELRVSMFEDRWTVHAGYAWDGCSPKFRVGGLWVGTPDFEESRLASLIHDTGYQFLDVRCFPIPRHEIDCLFGRIINRNGNRWAAALVFAGAVWLFGGIHRWIGTALGVDRKGSCQLLTRNR